MKLKLIIFISLFFSIASAQNKETGLASKPPMGWNSFDSYGVYLHEQAAYDNMKTLAEKYKIYGYEYFVIDNGWFGEYKLRQGTLYANEKHASDVHINEYGLVQPSQSYFPNGFKDLIDQCHSLGLKFGVHLMRGIPRKAVEKNTMIKNTNYHARDIADMKNVCRWCTYNYGVDMSKPGAQEFYNSLVNQFAEWGVDFIKVDDIVPYPKEVEALANAVAQCGREIILSLSPGDHVFDEDLPLLKRGNMLRVTSDIWDDQKGIDACFNAWRKWGGLSGAGFWIDMDMIPFGQLQLMSPTQEKDEETVLLSGRGNTRKSLLNPAQMRTFITMRALSASPLMIGGDLPTMDDYSFRLLTNKDMLAANQNGIAGHLVYEQDGIEIWKTPRKKGKGGWIGIFNRNNTEKSYQIKLSDLDLKRNKQWVDIWNNTSVSDVCTIGANDVVFIRY